jgi:hypothetical protein
MPCSNSISKTPGSPTSGTGYAVRLTNQAIRCDQARLLSRLQGNYGCPVIQSNKSAIYSSILEQEAATGCQGLPPGTSSNPGAGDGFNSSSLNSSALITANNLALPSVGVPSSVLTQRIQQQTILNATAANATNPAARFSMYDRIIVPLPCIPTYPNTAIPQPSKNPICHIWPGT